jgi:hypothetical protein
MKVWDVFRVRSSAPRGRDRRDTGVRNCSVSLDAHLSLPSTGWVRNRLRTSMSATNKDDAEDIPPPQRPPSPPPHTTFAARGFQVVRYVSWARST